MADLYRDFVFTRNTVQVTDTDTTVQVEDVSLFPSNSLLAKSEFYIAFDSTLTYPHFFEIVRLLSVNVGTKTLTVQRAQAGTVAVAHPIVTYIKGTLNADQVRRLRSGERGTVAPTPDADIFAVGDRFYHSTEGRFYAFTGNTSFLRDSFTRAASATTMGSTEVQTVVGEVNGVLSPSVSQVVPYTAPWTPSGTNIFGINGNNQAYLVSGVAGANAVVNVGSANFDVTFDVFMSTTAGSDYGIFFRLDSEQRYGYYLQFQGTSATLFRLTNGSFAVVSGQQTTYATNAIRNWRVWVDGNRIRVLRANTSGIVETAIDYTETLTGFTVASTNYRPGAGVGIRYGNAAAVADTAIAWDNFTCTQPDNVGLNNPKPQGWAPVSSLLGPLDTSGYTLRQLARIESDLASISNHLDETLELERGMESTQGAHGRDLATISYHLDEWLEEYKSRPTYEALPSQLAGVAQTVDDIIEILQTLVRSGSGSPSGTPKNADVYYDTISKVFYVGVNDTWVQASFSGPGVVIPEPTYVSGNFAETSNRTFVIPAGAQEGDLAVVSVNTVHSGELYELSGWTLIGRGAYTTTNVNSWGIFCKKLTIADLTATHSFTGPSYTSDSTKIVRVYRNANFTTPTASNFASANRAQPSGSRTMLTPAITPLTTGVLVSYFFHTTYGQNLTVPSPQSNLILSSAWGSGAGVTYHGQASYDEVIDGGEVGVPTTPRSATTFHSGFYPNGSGVVASVLIPGVGRRDIGPAVTGGVGVPTRTDLGLGSLYLDGSSLALYVYTDTGWLGVNQRVVRVSADYSAKGNDYVIANTLSSGRSSVSPLYDAHISGSDTANPANKTLVTTKTDALVILIRGTWSTAGGFAGSTINGGAVTLVGRRQNFNGGPIADILYGNAKVQPGSQAISYVGATSSAIGAYAAFAVQNISGVGSTFTSVNDRNNITFTLPATGAGGFIVVYTTSDNGNAALTLSSDTGGLTWTPRGQFATGSNYASLYTSTWATAQNGTSVTLNFTNNNTTWGLTTVAFFPATGDPTVFDAANYSNITLPAPAVGTRIVVQSDDQASNEIRVTPTSGKINGNNSDVVSARYTGSIYTADGTNWFKLATGGGGGGSSASVVSKSTAYSVRSGEILLADATSGAFVVTLPSPAVNATLTVKKVDGSGNTVTLTPSTGLIDGAANIVLVSQYDAYTLVADGTNWWAI